MALPPGKDMATSRPIPTNRLKACQRRDGGRVGAQYARTKRKFQTILTACDQHPFVIGKPTFRSDQNSRAFDRSGVSQNRDGIGRRITGDGLIAENQPAVGAAGIKRLGKRRELFNNRNVEALGLLGSLYSIRQHPIVIHPRYLGMIGPHRPDAAAAHLAGLLRYEIETGLLHRREKKPQIGARRLCANPAFNSKPAVTPPVTSKQRAPFAVAPVEKRHGLAIPKPHHIYQVMLLLARRADLCVGEEIIVDKQPCPDIRCGHLTHLGRSGPLCKLSVLCVQLYAARYLR